MDWKIKEQNTWFVPEGGGAPLLGMGNIARPLHGLAPRTIMGNYEWGKIRKACYEAANNHCEICGVALGTKRGDPLMRQAHELYHYDYTEMVARFERPICLCSACHAFIHSGRAITCYKNHEPLWTKEYMLELAGRAFRLIDQWNKQHPDCEPVRVYETVLDWLEEPSLEPELTELIKQYNIEFWCAPNRKVWDNAWGKWRLIYNDTEYWSPYQSEAEWQEALRPHKESIENKDLFAGDEFEELRKNLQKS